MKSDIEKVLESSYENIYWWLEFYLPKIFWAIIIIWIGLLISIWIYRLITFLFKKFKILELIDKLDVDFSNENKKSKKKNNQIKLSDKIAERIKIDDIIAKSVSYYIFLVFFRLSIVKIWIDEVEDFLWGLIAYLPSLFIWFLIWFFWIRFANFVHDIVFHALNLTKQQTSKIIATSAQIIILFFTTMAVLNKVWIATEIINIILIWFISMLTIAWWLAFGLWWKDIAREILESFRK